MDNVQILLVAGGSGRRMRSDVPKQFLPLAGRPVLVRTLETMARLLPGAEVVVVLPEPYLDRWAALCRRYAVRTPHHPVAGGATRFGSVVAGLAALPESTGLIAVHDGVRPFVDGALIERGMATARRSGAALPVVEAVDSFRIVHDDGTSERMDRTRLRAVQTPQFFDAALLRRAYRVPFNDAFTDDGSVVEASGVEVTLFDGDPRNLKITTPSDLAWAEAFIARHGEDV